MNIISISAGDSVLPRIDYHMHSVFSDGLDFIEDNVKRAVELGLEQIAFTDHVWHTSDWIDRYIGEIERLRQKYPGIKILIGVEAKALNRKGEVDVSEDTADKVDFVMGVCHDNLPLDKEYKKISDLSPELAAQIETEVTKGLLRNPQVAFVGHPARTFYKFFYAKTNRRFPDNLFEDIIFTAKEADKPLEVNARVPFYLDFCRLLLKNNCRFVLGSDAHAAAAVGKIDYAQIEEMMKNE